MTKLITLVKKDIKLIFNVKFILLLIVPLIAYSLYISFFYINLDVEPLHIYYFGGGSITSTPSNHINIVNDIVEFNRIDDEMSVKVDFLDGQPRITLCSFGSDSNDRLIVGYSLAKLFSEKQNPLVTVGNYNRNEKLRREMTCEVLFFVIITMIFMGASSILFKEKDMGVLKIFKISPVSIVPFIISKCIIFLIINLVIAVFLIYVNIGYMYIYEIMELIWLDVAILSIIVVLTSHLCLFLLSNFKQFSLLFAFVITFMMSPVFLMANTPVHVPGIEYYPLHVMYMSLKAGFFGRSSIDVHYYLASFVFVLVLIYILNCIAKRKLGEL